MLLRSAGEVTLGSLQLAKAIVTIEQHGLGLLAPGGWSIAYDVSADGAVVVGLSRDASETQVAFIWTKAQGMRSLKTVLEEEYGLDLTGLDAHECQRHLG